MDPRSIIEALSRLAFASASLVLMAMSFGLVIYGGIEVAVGIGTSREDGSTALLAAIGYVVIAMAVFDVAKYFVEEEEVIRGREMRNAGEARRSLTKFISTISIAVFIEGLVLVFRSQPPERGGPALSHRAAVHRHHHRDRAWHLPAAQRRRGAEGREQGQAQLKRIFQLVCVGHRRRLDLGGNRL